MKLVDYEIIEGKPHGGLFFGKHIFIDPLDGKDLEKNPNFHTSVDELISHFKKLDSSLEMRKQDIIYRPPYFASTISQSCTLGLKCLLWGRAFKVMKLMKKNKFRYKKVYVSGKRKRVRIR